MPIQGQQPGSQTHAGGVADLGPIRRVGYLSADGRVVLHGSAATTTTTTKTTTTTPSDQRAGHQTTTSTSAAAVAASGANDDFYAVLDAYLRNNKVALKDLFARFDVDRNGYLDNAELANFLVHLYPNITDSDRAYFAVMLDPNSDGKVQLSEIIETLTDASKAGAKVRRSAGGAQENAALEKVARAVKERGEQSARELFDRQAATGAYAMVYAGDKMLHPTQLASFFRQLVPSLKKHELLDVIANVHAFDPSRALTSWRDLKIVTGLKKAQQKTSLASAKSGVEIPKEDASKAAPASAMHAQHTSLAEIKATNGRALYLDIRSGRVFDTPAEDAWPQPVGFVTDAVRRSYAPGKAAKPLEVTFTEAASDTPFAALDTHVQRSGVDAVLAKHGASTQDGKRVLTAQGLHAIITEVKPGTPEHISRYAYEVIDAAGKGRVPSEDLAKALGEARRAEAACRSRDRGPLASELAKVAGAVARAGATRLKGMWARHDRAKKGAISLRALVSFVRELRSEITSTEVRSMLVMLRSLDHPSCNPENLYSLDDLRLVLRLYRAPIPLISTGVTMTTTTTGNTAAGQHATATTTTSQAYGVVTSTRLRDENWVLSLAPAHTAGGQTYLWDRNTSRAYVIPHEDPYPLYAGTYDYGSARVHLRPFVKFFDILDDYLKNTQQRLSSIFSEFAHGAPGLDRVQMEAFLRRLMSHQSLSAPDVDYVCTLLDVNEDGVVTLAELIEVAKQCRKIEDEVRMPNRSAAMAILNPLADSISQYADAHGGATAMVRTFARYDASARLTHNQVMQAVKELAPGAMYGGDAVRSLRYLLAALHALDTDGRYSAQELREVLRLQRAVNADSRNVAAVSVSGTSAAPGAHMAAAVPVAAPAAGYGHQPSARLLDATWPLRVSNHQGIPYYVDDASGRLFETPAADPWPLAVGELRGGAVYIASPQHNFFDLLDEYLKMTSSRLSDVFARFLVPGNESRGLERGGFTNFLREVIGAKMHLRAPQIDYFWAMLDVNSDGFVSNTELLTAAKDCRSVDRDMRMPDRRVAHAVLAEVQRAADALGSDGLVTLWQRLDSSGGMSRLDYVAAMRVAMEVRKQQASAKELRYVAAALRSLDSCETGDGRFTLHDFRVALRLYKSPVMLHASTGIGVAPSPVPMSHPSSSAYPVHQPGNVAATTLSGQSMWRLQEQRFEGKTYLFDPETRQVYFPPRTNGDPLVLAGTVKRVGNSDVIELKNSSKFGGYANTQGSNIIDMMDRYLKERSVRLRDLFDSFDTNRNGRLETDELGRFFQLFIPSMSQLQVDYLAAVIDTDGDGSVSFDELLNKIKVCHNSNQALYAKASVDIQDVHDKIEAYLVQNRMTLSQMFDRFADARAPVGSHVRAPNPGPRISQHGLANLLREIFPGPSGARATQLAQASVLRAIDYDGDSLLSFEELERAMGMCKLQVSKLNDVQARTTSTVSWVHRGDVGNTTGNSRGARGARADARASALASDRYALSLEPTTISGVQYYVDQKTGKLFQLGDRGANGVGSPQNATDAPRYVGRLVQNGHGGAHSIEFADGPGGMHQGSLGLFERLDEHLKTNTLRLAEVFRSYDSNGDGSLDRYEAENFLRSFLPEMTSPQADFMRVMLDPNGDGFITYDELIHVIRECKTMDYRMLCKDNMGLAELRFKLGIKMGPELDWLFQKFDSDRSGTLEMNEVLSMIKEGFPGITSMQQRAIYTCILQEADENFDGNISLPELKQALGYISINLVPPKWTDKRRSSAVYHADTAIKRSGSMSSSSGMRVSFDEAQGARYGASHGGKGDRNSALPEWVLDPIIVDGELMWHRAKTDRVYRFVPGTFRPCTDAMRASAPAPMTNAYIPPYGSTATYGASTTRGQSLPDDDDLLCVGALMSTSSNASAPHGKPTPKHMQAPYVQQPGEPHPRAPRATFVPSSIRSKSRSGATVHHGGAPCVRYESDGNKGDVLAHIGDAIHRDRSASLEHALQRFSGSRERLSHHDPHHRDDNYTRHSAPSHITEHALADALAEAIPSLSLTTNQVKYIYAMAVTATRATTPRDIARELGDVCAAYGSHGWHGVATHRTIDTVLSRISATVGSGDYAYGTLRSAYDANAGHGRHVDYEGFMDILQRVAGPSPSREETQCLLTRLFRLMDDDEEGAATFSEVVRTLRLTPLKCHVDASSSVQSLRKVAEPIPLDLAAKELMHLKSAHSKDGGKHHDGGKHGKDGKHNDGGKHGKDKHGHNDKHHTDSTDFGRLALSARSIGYDLDDLEHGSEFWDAAARLIGNDDKVRRAVTYAMRGAMSTLAGRGGRRGGRGGHDRYSMDSYSDDDYSPGRRRDRYDGRPSKGGRALIVQRGGRSRSGRGEFVMDLLDVRDEYRGGSRRHRRRGYDSDSLSSFSDSYDSYDSYDDDYSYADRQRKHHSRMPLDGYSEYRGDSDGVMQATAQALSYDDDYGARHRRIGGGYGVPVLTEKRDRGSRLSGGQLRRLGSILDASEMATHLVDDVTGQDISKARGGDRYGRRSSARDPSVTNSTFGRPRTKTASLSSRRTVKARGGRAPVSSSLYPSSLSRSSARPSTSSETWQPYRPSSVTSRTKTAEQPGWLRRELQHRGESIKPHKSGYAKSAPMIYGTNSRGQAADALEAYNVMTDAAEQKAKAGYHDAYPHGAGVSSYGHQQMVSAGPYDQHPYQYHPQYPNPIQPSAPVAQVHGGYATQYPASTTSSYYDPLRSSHSSYDLAFPRMGGGSQATTTTAAAATTSMYPTPHQMAGAVGYGGHQASTTSAYPTTHQIGGGSVGYAADVAAKPAATGAPPSSYSTNPHLLKSDIRQQLADAKRLGGF
ncbi:hypothetical protein NFJ02_04g117730 [Pycnococcus provasolii]